MARLLHIVPSRLMAIGLAALTIMMVLRAFDPGALENMRLAAFDAYQRHALRDYLPAPVRVIDIDDKSLSEIGQWPWPRRKIAALIDRANMLGAAAIGLDIVFAEPDRASPHHLQSTLAEEGYTTPPDRAQPWPNYDRELAEAFKRARVVTSFGLVGVSNGARPAIKTGLAIIGADATAALPKYAGAVMNLPAFEAAAKGNGSFSVITETDKTIRQAPMLTRLGDQVYPSIVLELLRVAQGASSIAIKGADAGFAVGGGVGVAAVRVGQLEAPLESDGRLRLHYAGAVPERSIPAWRFFTAPDADLMPLIAGHILLVGSSAVGLADLRATPLNAFEPGVNIHAEALEQILGQDWLQRPAWSSAMEAVFACLAALLTLLALARWGGFGGAATACVAIFGATGAAIVAYSEANLLLDATFPVAAILTVYVTAATSAFLKTEREKAQLRDAFGQYLSPGLVNQIAADPSRLALGGEARDMTFLFTDLEGFAALTESLAPAKLVAVLNAYLDGLCAIVMDHGGAIDKIVGDAVHAMFNAPVDMPDHPERAVRCALALDAFAMGFTERMRAEGLAFGITRIGVNTGTAIVGNFGGETRFDYTAHGDAINTAARLEAANKKLGTRICVAQATAGRATSIRFRPIGKLMLKGKENGVDCVEPVLDGAMTDAQLQAYREAWMMLSTDAARAAERFQTIADARPDDTLAALHASRAKNGFGQTPIQLAG